MGNLSLNSPGSPNSPGFPGSPNLSQPFSLGVLSRVLTSFCALAALTGCSAFSANSGGGAGGSFGLSSAAATGTTVLIPTQQNLFASNVALVQTPASSNTFMMYARPKSVLERQNLLPVNPQAANLNSSQQLVFMIAGTEHCRDLITAEAAISDGSKSTRKFFKSQNLAAGSGAPSAADFQNAAITLGNAFWRRQPTDEEQSLFTNMYSEMSSQGLSNQNLYIALCNVELASASALVH